MGFYYPSNYTYDPLVEDLGDFIINVSMSLTLVTLTLVKFVLGIKTQEKLASEMNIILKAQNDELKSLNFQNKFKTELITMIAHDLRDSTSSFKDLTQKLNYLIKGNELDKVLKMGDFFESSSLSLFLNLDNLLSWVISQNRKVSVKHSEFELDSLIQETVADLNHFITDKSLVVNKQIDESIALNTDRNMLKIVLRNIIENAIKHSPKSTSIHIETSNNDANLELKIKDMGKGLDEEILRRISSNLQLDAKLETESHGLGLPICFHFSKMLGMELNFKNSETQGAEVKISIPKTLTY